MQLRIVLTRAKLEDRAGRTLQEIPEWNSRVSLILTQELKLKRISFLDVVFESNPNDSDDVFDADAAIATGELMPLLQDLVRALDGEQASVR